MTMKTKIVLITALGISVIRLGIAADIEVSPTGDSEVDIANLHAALASAAPGDTISLGAGVFDLTPPDKDPADCSLDVTVPLPDGDSLRFWDAFAKPDACNPKGDTNSWGPRNMWEMFLVDKSLTIRGEAGPLGPLSILRVDSSFSEAYHRIAEEDASEVDFRRVIAEADSFVFLVGAAGVTFENLEFDGPTNSIQTFWAGTTIKDCVFRAVGFGPFFFPDERSIYPHYPTNFDHPLSSYFEGNVFINSQQGIHIGGSEIIVTGNTFDHYGAFAVYISAYANLTLLADEGGEGMPLVRAVAQNNRIENNKIVNGAPGVPRIVISTSWGGPVRGNVVSNNTIKSDSEAVVLSEGNGYSIDGSTLSDNTVLNNDIRESNQ